MAIQLGDVAPDFTAQTTEGTINLNEYLGDGWGILFSHPADFTPVCTTELGAVAKLRDEFAKRHTKVIAAAIIADQGLGEQPSAYTGQGSCYVEYGGGRVARVDVDFMSGPAPTGSFMDPSLALAGEKKLFGSSRRARWFGL